MRSIFWPRSCKIRDFLFLSSFASSTLASSSSSSLFHSNSIASAADSRLHNEAISGKKKEKKGLVSDSPLLSARDRAFNMAFFHSRPPRSCPLLKKKQKRKKEQRSLTASKPLDNELQKSRGMLALIIRVFPSFFLFFFSGLKLGFLRIILFYFSFFTRMSIITLL